MRVSPHPLRAKTLLGNIKERSSLQILMVMVMVMVTMLMQRALSVCLLLERQTERGNGMNVQHMYMALIFSVHTYVLLWVCNL